MAHPLNLPGRAPTTEFGRRGTHWSCQRDERGGIHTGADWGWDGIHGHPVYAVEDGDVRYRNYGSAFGLQLAVSPDGADSGEWFYAHLSARVPDGTRVKAGDLVGRIGNTGNSTGPHLHLEWKKTKGAWFCGDHKDPWPRIQQLDGDRWQFPDGHTIYLSKLTYEGHETNPDDVSDSIMALQEMLNRHPLTGGTNLPVSGKYLDLTDAEVIKCQTQHGFGADKPGESFVGPGQLRHLIDTTGAPYRMVDDREQPDPAPGPDVPAGGRRFVTFNWAGRYDTGGLDADWALWQELTADPQVVAIGLQEAWWVYNKLLREKATGWRFVTARVSDGKPSGEVLAIRESWGTVVDEGSTFISPYTPVQDEAAGPNPHKEKHIVWADVKDADTGEVWYVGNVHLAPSKHMGGAIYDLWVRQAEACVQWIGRQGDRCVLLGDFNCEKNHEDAARFRRVGAVRTAKSHGRRRIDWVVVKDTPLLTSTPGVALPNRGQSDHKPVTTLISESGVKPPAPTGRLRGIDISDHQKGIDLQRVDADFVIVKATEGKGYENPEWKTQYGQARAAARLVGLYHFARNDLPGGLERARAEADYFVDTIGAGVVGEALLVLDWERGDMADTGWAKVWLDRVHARTGVRAVVYMSESVTHIADWSGIGADHLLWVAKYRDRDPDVNYDMSNAGPEPRVAWPGGWAMWQWTADGLLDGWDRGLDVNIAASWFTADEWAAVAAPAGSKPDTPDTPDVPDEGDAVTRQEFDTLAARVDAVEKKVDRQVGRLRDATAAGLRAAAEVVDPE